MRAFSDELLLVGLWHRICIPSNKKKDKVLWKEQPLLMYGGKLSYIEKERDAVYMNACFCLVKLKDSGGLFVRNIRNSVFIMCNVQVI